MRELHYKYLDLCEDEDMTASDIVDLIFKECRISLKIDDDSLFLSERIRAKKYGKAKHEAKDINEFVSKMNEIDYELDLMSIDELENEYVKLKNKDML